MSLYVYGAAEAERPAPAVRGLDGAAVRMLACGSLAIAASDHHSDLPPLRARLEAHNAVNMALVASGGVVPFRYGNVFADEPALVRALAPQAEGLAAKLRELAGCCELTLRLRAEGGPAPVPAPTRPGTQYLRRKRSVYARATEARERLSALAIDFRESSASLACLIPSARALEAMAAVPGLSGPWPPSSFV